MEARLIDVYFFPTPNGRKVTIFAEEAGLPYRLVPVDITRGAQFDPGFLKIGPNNKIPVIVDNAPADRGPPLAVMESGAILVYLAEKTGLFLPTEARPRAAVMQWVMWQMANQGPKFGENSHHRRAALNADNGDLSYPVERFETETRRCYGVMDRQLAQTPYLAGEGYSLADIINYPWAALWKFLGVDLSEFPNVARWMETVAARPATARGMSAGAELRGG